MLIPTWTLHAIVTLAVNSPCRQAPESNGDLVVGRPLQGEVVDGDPEISTETLEGFNLDTAVRGNRYSLEVPESGEYHIDLHSHFFDAYLVLEDETGAVLAEDDDGWMRTHSRIGSIDLVSGRQYRVVAGALHGERGPFTLVAKLGPGAALSPMQRRRAELEDTRRAVSATEEQLGLNHVTTAKRLHSCAYLLWQQGNHNEARPLYERALRIREGQLGTNHPSTIATLNNLALLLRDQGHYDEAQSLYERALEACEEHLGPHHWQTAVSHSNLAGLFRDQGRFAEAKPHYERALKLGEEGLGEDHPDVAGYLTNLGGLVQEQGFVREARDLFERALRICEKNLEPNHLDTAATLNNLAALHQRQGNYGEARALFERVLLIREEQLGSNHPHTTISVSNLAGLLQDQGDHDEALALYERALKTDEEQFGSNHPVVAARLGNLATILDDLGRTAEAQAIQERALKISEAQLGLNHPKTARHLNNLATLLRFQGKVDEARALYERALKISEEQLGRNHPHTAVSTNNLAGLFRETGELDAALPLYERSLKIREEQLGADHPETAGALSNLAGLLRMQGKMVEARALYGRSLDICQKLVSNMAPSLSEREYFQWVTEIRRQIDVFNLTSDMMDYHESYKWSLIFKGVASQQLRQQQAWRLESRDPEELRISRRLQELVASLSDRFNGKGHPLSSARLTELRREKEGIERALAQRASRQKTRLAVDPAVVIGALEDDDALVDLVSYRVGGGVRFFAFVLLKGQEVQRVDLGSPDELRQVIAEPNAIRTQDDVIEASVGAASTGRRFWQRIAPHIGDAKRIFVCPDGLLATLAFETLPGEKKGTFLIEEYSFVYLQHAGDLLRESSRATGQGALIVGGVHYGATRTGEASKADTVQAGSSLVVDFKSSDSRGVLLSDELLENWAPLAKSLHEAKDLAGYFADTHKREQATLLVGDAATEERLKQEISGKRYVHLATHGYFAPEYLVSVGDEARKLALKHGPQHLDATRRQLSGWLPGLLSGIVLAGANDKTPNRREDGILTASEAIWLDLGSCDLVTLSACDSALGTERGGEQLIGLRRALQIAGARTTITSLRKVDDEVAYALMRDMYKRLWVDGESKSDALRNAQLAMLKENREIYGEGRPETWGAFVLEGDWR